MSMSKRIQIPISEPEEQLFKLAAKKRGLSLAEWARGHLKEKSQMDLGAEPLSPQEALKELFEIRGSIDSVEVMNKEAVKGRYK
jgi:hypothetical protein